jgi:hypothetical protein
MEIVCISYTLIHLFVLPLRYLRVFKYELV